MTGFLKDLREGVKEYLKDSIDDLKDLTDDFRDHLFKKPFKKFRGKNLKHGEAKPPRREREADRARL